MIMKKIYLFLVVLTTLFSAQIVVAQENKPTTQKQEPIEGLTIYPNPVSSGKIYKYYFYSQNPDDAEKLIEYAEFLKNTGIRFRFIIKTKAISA